MSRFFILIIVSFCLIQCKESVIPTDEFMQEGISKELADYRSSHYSHIHYQLSFSLSESPDSLITGNVSINIQTKNDDPIILDFNTQDNKILHISEKELGETIYSTSKEHIFIPPLGRGQHTFNIQFQTNSHNIHHRGNFLYTLFVPAKAHNLFPCFDQPDLKAIYKLRLDVPGQWMALSNAKVKSEENKGGRNTITFEPSELLSTYHFAFVAGVLKEEFVTMGTNQMCIAHLETDNQKIAQIPEIFSLMSNSVQWMEEYTDIPQPYSKYDAVIIPNFEFGGMEHPGLIFYNDKSIFLEKDPDDAAKLNRIKLIAHETVHLWFGDLVTMRWFDDVWIKEVFANYFAAKISEPLFPTINHKLSFLYTMLPSLYDEDRTEGANPICQTLPNLNQAGLIYGSIIYNKSVIAFNDLVDKIGATNFRNFVKHYLHNYSYKNASWEQLLAILKLYDKDAYVDQWDATWFTQKGRPVYSSTVFNNYCYFKSYDKWNNKQNWKQHVTMALVDTNANLIGGVCYGNDSIVTVPLNTDEIIIPNSDGRAYGCWLLNEQQCLDLFKILPRIKDDVARFSILTNLYENVQEHQFNDTLFLNNIHEYLTKETNQLLYIHALNCYHKIAYKIQPLAISEETFLWKLYTTTTDKIKSNKVLQVMASLCNTPELIQNLYTIWEKGMHVNGTKISVSDLTTLTYQLALRMPERFALFSTTQSARITNLSRKDDFLELMRCINPDEQVRHEALVQLLQLEGRVKEPLALQALRLAVHPMNKHIDFGFVHAALDSLQSVQQTGDIFFPKQWCSALLSGKNTPELYSVVDSMVVNSSAVPPLLMNKLLQAADPILNAYGKKQ